MSWITIPRAKLVNAEPGPAQATSIQKTAYALQNPGGSTRTPYNTPADAPPIAVARGVTGAGRAISAARAKFTGGPVAAPNRPNSLEMISRRMATSLQIGGAPVAPEQGIVAPTFE